jgi:hypothetical protein
MRIWHYTTWPALEGIFNDGLIKRDRIYLSGEIPGVWLSTNANWEETVRKAIISKKTGLQTIPFSRDDLFKHGITPIRIEIDTKKVNIVDWKTHCKKLSKNISQSLEVIAKQWGANPIEWRVSYKPIPVKSFISPIEQWDGKKWIEALTKN